MIPRGASFCDEVVLLPLRLLRRVRLSSQIQLNLELLTHIYLTQKILYNQVMKKIRIALAILLLLISLSLLIWAFLPTLVESRVLPIPPADLQLPTPSAFIYYGEV